jgi:hypothetical protein
MLSLAEDDRHEQAALESNRAQQGHLAEAARQRDYIGLRSARDAAQRNATRYGALRSQLASWVTEFQRVVRGSSSEVGRHASFHPSFPPSPMHDARVSMAPLLRPCASGQPIASSR